MKKTALKFILPVLSLVMIFSFVVSQVSAATVVNPSNMNDWAFEFGQIDGGFVAGPNGQPLGSGSAHVASGSNPEQVLHKSFVNTQLSNVTNLKYSAFGTSSSFQPVLVIYVTTNLGQDVISFNPNEQVNAQANTWQEWDTLSPTAKWRSQSFTPCDEKNLSQYISCAGGLNPIIDDNTGDSTKGLRFKTGPSVDGYVDNFTIGISGSDTTYDFEPDAVPSPSPTPTVVPTPTPTPTPTPIPTPTPSPSPAANAYTQQFYSDNNFTNPVGSPTTVNTNGFALPLKNIWPGSPAAGVPTDNFSVRTEGTFDFVGESYQDSPGNYYTYGKYNFSATSDFKIKVTIDPGTVNEAVVINKTTRGAVNGSRFITPGVHTIRVDYVSGVGSAIELLSVNRVKGPFPYTTSCFDLNGDRVVNSGDLGLAASVFNAHGAKNYEQQLQGTSGAALAPDLNSDGVVNSGDLGLLANKYSKPCPY